MISSNIYSYKPLQRRFFIIFFPLIPYESTLMSECSFISHLSSQFFSKVYLVYATLCICARQYIYSSAWFVLSLLLPLIWHLRAKFTNHSFLIIRPLWRQGCEYTDCIPCRAIKLDNVTPALSMVIDTNI